MAGSTCCLACAKGMVLQHRVSARALLVAMACWSVLLVVMGDVKERVVSGSTQRQVLSLGLTPVHRQWVASVREETTAVFSC